MKLVKILAYSGALSGIVISLWANIRDAYIPEIPHGVDPELWRPGYAGYHSISPDWFDLALAIFFPVALLVALELLVRVEWSKGVKDLATRWGGIALMAGIAGLVSYWHLRTAMLLNGADVWIASLGPLAVDGFVFMCIQVLMKLAEQERAAPPAPNLVPPPPLLIPNVPPANVPPPLPAVPPVSSPALGHVSPGTSPTGTPVGTAPVHQDTAPDVHPPDTPGQVDKPQATAVVPPSMSPSAGGVDMGGQDLPAPWDAAAMSPTVSREDTPQDTDAPTEDVPQDTAEEDTDPEGDTGDRGKGGQGLTPADLERWEMKQAGKTKAQIAALHNVSTKTVYRSWQKVEAAHEAAEKDKEKEHADA